MSCCTSQRRLPSLCAMTHVRKSTRDLGRESTTKHLARTIERRSTKGAGRSQRKTRTIVNEMLSAVASLQPADGDKVVCKIETGSSVFPWYRRRSAALGCS